jgi:hypothetical protein
MTKHSIPLVSTHFPSDFFIFPEQLKHRKLKAIPERRTGFPINDMETEQQIMPCLPEVLNKRHDYNQSSRDRFERDKEVQWRRKVVA